MEKRLELLFQNSSGRQVSLAILDPKPDLTNQEIENAMQLILDKNIFNISGGDLVKILGARLISREEEMLFEY
ncbi:MAG TPA: DUF2922 domain-containing protein [Clostridia bacterium]|jgi:hypothetical protein|nr:DUF2922 domain-containing protein [Clostridia bacterium]